MYFRGIKAFDVEMGRVLRAMRLSRVIINGSCDKKKKNIGNGKFFSMQFFNHDLLKTHFQSSA